MDKNVTIKINKKDSKKGNEGKNSYKIYRKQ